MIMFTTASTNGPTTSRRRDGKPVVFMMLTLLMMLCLHSTTILHQPSSVSAFSTAATTTPFRRTCDASRTSKSLLSSPSESESDTAAASTTTTETFGDSSSKDNSYVPTATTIAFEERFDKNGKGGFDEEEFKEILASMDMDATPEESRVMFAYLDSDGNGFIDYEEFATWYGSAVEESVSSSTQFRELLMSRQTVNSFEAVPVSDDVLRRAIECAIMAPNRSGSEPWRFIKLGTGTVQQIQQLNTELLLLATAAAEGDNNDDDAENNNNNDNTSFVNTVEDWTNIPGWCVVTTKLSPEDPDTELKDFRSTSCAMQNFMLSMWSEGVGSKWTEGPTQKTPQFADLVGIDTATEKVVGIIWYGFSKQTDLHPEERRQRQKSVEDVLSILP